ncbi:MAG: S-methyl-5-thioribose-1-phosphate isomerase [Gemmatimonadales bacterium]
MVSTLRWSDGLELLDQTKLPHDIAYVRCNTGSDVAGAIKAMIVRGAPAIGCAAAYGVALDARRFSDEAPQHFDERMENSFALLANSRPTAVNLAWALGRMKSLLYHERNAGKDDLSKVAKLLLEEAHRITNEDISANKAMGGYGADLLKDGQRVLTHCNAGALATAGHGTALGVIRSAIAQGKKISVYAGETRPWLQGSRLTAWELMQDNIPVTLIADVAAGYLMSEGSIDAVIVGADRIAANGDTANKIGTYQLAVLAEKHGIPFYVAAPTSTVDLSTPSGRHIVIEERDAAELTSFAGRRTAPENVQTRNPVFDVTPADLIDAIITEKGISMKGDHPARLVALVSG